MSQTLRKANASAPQETTTKKELYLFYLSGVWILFVNNSDFLGGFSFDDIICAVFEISVVASPRMSKCRIRHKYSLLFLRLHMSLPLTLGIIFVQETFSWQHSVMFILPLFTCIYHIICSEINCLCKTGIYKVWVHIRVWICAFYWHCRCFWQFCFPVFFLIHLTHSKLHLTYESIWVSIQYLYSRYNVSPGFPQALYHTYSKITWYITWTW